MTKKAILLRFLVGVLLALLLVFSWLTFGIEVFAAALVAVGCVGELMLVFKTSPSEKEALEHFEKAKHVQERIFVCMVAIGVTIELIVLPSNLEEVASLREEVSQNELQVAGLNRESAELFKVGEQAKESAAKATGELQKAKEAVAKATEAAETAKAEREKAESGRLELEKQVIALEAKTKPREITVKQMMDFTDLMQLVKKIPIKICISQECGDSETFASQMREMFTHARFTNDSTAGPFGITRDPSRVQALPLGVTNDFSDVEIIFWSTNEEHVASKPAIIPAVGFPGSNLPNLPYVAENGSDEQVFNAISYAFQKIGIKAVWLRKNEWVNPGQFEIFISVR